MTAWPKHNEERHRNPWNRPWCARCTTECLADSPCRCCETARADEAEAEAEAHRLRHQLAGGSGLVAPLPCEQQNDALRATVARAREFQPLRSLTYRHGFDLSYIDGWNDALDRIEQAIDGGAE